MVAQDARDATAVTCPAVLHAVAALMAHPDADLRQAALALAAALMTHPEAAETLRQVGALVLVW